jgi:hypothetical protein
MPDADLSDISNALYPPEMPSRCEFLRKKFTVLFRSYTLSRQQAVMAFPFTF